MGSFAGESSELNPEIQSRSKFVDVLFFLGTWHWLAASHCTCHRVLISGCVCLQEEPIRGFRVGEHLEYMLQLENKFRKTILGDMLTLTKPTI